MKVQIRHGVFETNSSSTHSLVLFHQSDIEKLKLKDTDAPPDDYGYHWNNFILVSDDAKLDYLVATIRANFNGYIYEKLDKETYDSPGYTQRKRKAEREVENVLFKLIEKYFPPKYDPPLHSEGVDHASKLHFDVNPKNGRYNEKKFRTIYNMVMRQGTVVFGGNDNEYEPTLWDIAKSHGKIQDTSGYRK